MIGIWAHPDDDVALTVLRALRRANMSTVFLDSTDLTADNDREIIISGRRLALAELAGLYVRPGHHLVRTLHEFADKAPVLTINRPSAGLSNFSKPYQATLIREAGLGTPDTILTTTPDAARAFVSEHKGAVIYKSISSVRSICARWSTTAEARITDIASCPTQLQEQLPPPDFRLHVVGDDVFGCEIKSDCDDYRYARRLGGRLRMRKIDVPEIVASRALALSAQLGLIVAGLDLRLRDDGTWCCLEVNPSPAFTFYEPVAREITSAVVDAFAEPRS
jgi:glutathione synthase/RimK-type ligase-like ATP-grasp enzyme